VVAAVAAAHGIYEQAAVKWITGRSRDSPSIYPASSIKDVPQV